MNDKEFDSLRSEIQNWQSRKFTVVGAAIAFVSAINGWMATGGQAVIWHVAAALPLMVLIGAALLTWLAGRGICYRSLP